MTGEGERVRIEEIAGQRIRERREELGRTQEGLGKAIGERLGREWPRQAVSAAERGKRSFTAAELVAIAHALGTNVQQLLTPPPGIGEIELADGVAIDRALLAGALSPGRITDKGLERIQEVFSRLLLHVNQLNQAADDVHEDMNLMRELSLAVHQAEAGAAPEQPIVAAIVTSDRGVLVGKRNDGKPPFTFIAGEIEPGESPADAAIREVKEETGLRIQAGQVIGERVHPKTGRTMIYLAAAPTHGTDVFVGDEDELAEVRWVTLDEADELLRGMYEPVREHLARELRDRGEF